MNPIDDQLNRLFRAASQGAPTPDAVPPFGMDARVLASWRASRSMPSGFWDMGVLVRGMIVAGVIMAVSFLPALSATTSSSTASNPFADFLQLTDTTVTTDVAQ